MKQLLIKIFPYILCFLVSLALWRVCQINRELVTRLETTDVYLDSLNASRDSLVVELSDYQITVDSLESDIDLLKKAKKTVIEQVKEVRIVNDTIRELVVLNEINDSIISKYEVLLEVKDTLIAKQSKIILRDSEHIDYLNKSLMNKEAELRKVKEQCQAEEKKKIFWKATTICAVGVITVLII